MPNRPPDRIHDLLALLLEQPDGFQIGQISVTPGFLLHHIDDAGQIGGLENHTSAEKARELCLYDAEGKFRPLKSAPNLPRGWLLTLSDLGQVRLALDYFYPAALGMWLDYLRGRLQPTDWRETVNRQTGMYRIVGKITDDQSDELIRKACDPTSGCLRTMLWKISPELPGPRTSHPDADPSQRQVPVLCREACNILVAEGRKVVKAAQPPPPSN